MVFSESNWLAVIVAVVINIVIGFIWYGPLFGKQWMKLIGMTDKQMKDASKKGMMGSMIWMIITTLVTVCVTGWFISALGVVTAMGGAMIGFYIWLGFIATYSLGEVIWQKRSWNLWVLNNVYQLIIFLIIGIILAVWR